MPRHILTAFATLVLALAGPAFADAPDIDKVNGSIRLDAGQQAGDLETVNGSIHLADGASADDVSTVNGDVELGTRSTVSTVDTVNGGIDLGEGSRVTGKVEAVNGSIRVRRDAEVLGHASNVNGTIEIDAAHLAGGLETVSGDIEIGADARVEGGLLVDKPHGWSWGKTRNPRIVIGPRAVVEGTLEFRREVDLFVSDSAKIGKVTGATPQAFSGDLP